MLINLTDPAKTKHNTARQVGRRKQNAVGGRGEAGVAEQYERQTKGESVYELTVVQVGVDPALCQKFLM